jgi:hypothetical protein
VRAHPPSYRQNEQGLDAADARKVAQRWAELLGCDWQAMPLDGASVDREAGEPASYVDEGKDFFSVADIPGAPFASLDVAPVPEPKSAKNRVHVDVFGDTAEIVARGATLLTGLPRWDVLADPEGNEFCVFPPA